jgi:large subunit ribosomal protein L6
MSRIGNKPVIIPEGVTVEDKGNALLVKGKKGEILVSLNSGISAEIKEKEIVFTRQNEQKQTKQNHGTVRANVHNAVVGVSQGFSKSLEMIGIGYKAVMDGKNVVLSAGYSHNITIVPEEGVTISLKSPTEIVCEGISKQAVGQTAARIREVRTPEPYLGKGIRYKGEYVATKEGKRAAAGGKK